MDKDGQQTNINLHIKDWPEEDRPREILLEIGPEALSDAALLAILQRTGRQGQNAIALAREMINKFGGLHGLMAATSENLLGIKGIGKK
jgi:DNA repair protein RadC